MSARSVSRSSCGGGVESGATNFIVDSRLGVVVVRDVPASVCSQVGETWLEDAVAAELEIVVEDAKARK